MDATSRSACIESAETLIADVFGETLVGGVTSLHGLEASPAYLEGNSILQVLLKGEATLRVLFQADHAEAAMGRRKNKQFAVGPDTFEITEGNVAGWLFKAKSFYDAEIYVVPPLYECIADINLVHQGTVAASLTRGMVFEVHPDNQHLRDAINPSYPPDLTHASWTKVSEGAVEKLMQDGFLKIFGNARRPYLMRAAENLTFEDTRSGFTTRMPVRSGKVLEIHPSLRAVRRITGYSVARSWDATDPQWLWVQSLEEPGESSNKITDAIREGRLVAFEGTA